MTRRRLPHGYTNETWAAGGSIWKRYTGADGRQRMDRELAAIRAAASVVPTARILSVDLDQRLVEFARVEGVPGQALIERGLAVQVLGAAGRTLATLHSHPGTAWTHGDYGPQNILLDGTGGRVVLIADWEFATPGSMPLQDLAWAEWIVRMHHPNELDSVRALYDGYGERFAWDRRKSVMVDRCAWLRQRCEADGNADAARMWAERLTATLRWEAASDER